MYIAYASNELFMLLCCKNEANLKMIKYDVDTKNLANTRTSPLFLKKLHVCLECSLCVLLVRDRDREGIPLLLSFTPTSNVSTHRLRAEA